MTRFTCDPFLRSKEALMEGSVDSAFDVIVVGSGAGGMVAAVRAHDLGLSVLMAEKAHYYGGTSATSGGGTWIPLNDAVASEDSFDKAMTYLQAATKGQAREELLRVYVEQAQVMTKYVETLGVRSFGVPGYPDYYSELPGAMKARAMLPLDMDGAGLGDEFFRMRDHHPFLLAFDRYALNFEMAATISARLPGWRKAGLKMLAAYWLDIPWRMKTRIDRRLTMGRALVGGLRKAMMQRGIPLMLNTRLVELQRKSSRVTGCVFERNGRKFEVTAAKAVILASGGYEQNQQMRDAYMRVPTIKEASLTPTGGNTGEVIRAGQAVGAALENMENAWWCPSIRMPARAPGNPNSEISWQLFFERGRPGTISVNRLGKRFVNEAVSYDQFGQAMIADQLTTGANVPCWMIFDARYRSKHPAGGLLPSWVMPDKSLPPEWWDNVIFRADSIRGLAAKIGVNESNLSNTVAAMNEYAKTGMDKEFGRGRAPYDQFFGEPGITPNSCLGPLDEAPYYAMLVDLGDLGTKGGLRVDKDAAVLGTDGHPIEGLYAVGNVTGSLFAGTYPGAGATLGPAMTFGYVAANQIALQAAADNPVSLPKAALRVAR
jgi:3-oxosteroid 1-dehydrogenase